MMTLRHLELFAGIGGFRRAIDLFCADHNLVSKCIGFSEKDRAAVTTYKAIFNTDGEVEIGDINQITVDPSRISALPGFDILTGGFPCQSFSMMGRKLGFDDERGNVFYRIIDMLDCLAERKPPFILLENVKHLETHDGGNTIVKIRKSLESRGFEVFTAIFNSANFKLAQVRNRLFIFATSMDLAPDFEFLESKVLDVYNSLASKTSLLEQKTVLDVLSCGVDDRYYLSERIKPTILANGSKNFKSKSEINQLVARPLTATMVKLHRACQDNYYSDEFLQSPDPIKFLEKKFDKQELASHRIRRITPEEAFALQGFDPGLCQRARDAGVSNHQLYKQAGNAVSVNTVYAILYYLFVHKNLKDVVK